MSRASADITRILDDLNAGDASAARRLWPLVYDHLRALAAGRIQGGGQGHTLEPTALVHEAFLKLAGGNVQWNSRAHFMAVAATAMRQIVANHARARGAAKRGGGWQRITLEEAGPGGGGPDLNLLALDEALNKLSVLSERQARVVELRYFGGLTIDETAHVLGVGSTTVEDDWHVAKAWLRRELRGGDDE